MALEGTLKDLPLPDVIQLLSLSRKTGAVEITGSDGFGTGKLYFQQGKVVSAALEDMPPLDAAYFFFTFPDGTFYFNENEPPPTPDASIPVSNEVLIMEGINRADEWNKLRNRIPSLDLVLGLVADPVAGNRDINLKPDEWRVLTMISGRDSIRQIARRTGFGDLKTARIAHHLLSSGLIEPLGVQRSAPTPLAPNRGRAPAPPAAPGPGAAPVVEPPATVQNGTGGSRGPLPAETRPLGPAPLLGQPPGPAPVPEPPVSRPAPVPEPPALRPAPVPAPGPQVAGGSALYGRFEAIAVGSLGNSGRLLLSQVYRRMRIAPSADITYDVALKFCEQFERDASMLAGSGRARQLTERLRQAVNESFAGQG